MNCVMCLLEIFSPVTEMMRCDKINQAKNLAIKLENLLPSWLLET